MPIRKSSISGGSTPSGTTENRPANPSIGDTFFNGTLGVREIYTPSGWLAATGANDFNISISGTVSVIALNKEYLAGAYSISSSIGDTSFDVYAYDQSNNLSGYTNTPAISASIPFNKLIVYGGTAGDLMSFSYKTTFTGTASTTDTFSAPYVLSISQSDLPNVDDTVTITGGNFDTDVQVWFDGQNSYSEQAKSIVYGSSTSIVATRPDNLIEDNSPYSIRVINPGVTMPTGSNRHVISNISAGLDPIWSTPSGNIASVYHGSPFSFTFAASDESAVSYSIESGSLPAGLSLNSSTGEISGNSSEVGSILKSFTVAASDSSGNTVSRAFSMGKLADGGTETSANGYYYHTFTSNGTFQPLTDNADVEVLVVAGGGGGGFQVGGGGGAGGLRSTTTSLGVAGTSYSVTVGGGGAAAPNGNTYASSGQNSSFSNFSATGGGRGANHNATTSAAAAGGSGGGGSGNSNSQSTSGGAGNAGGYTPAEGNAGGSGNPAQWSGGGGGGAGAIGQNGTGNTDGGDGGDGTNAFSDWGAATSTGENIDGVYWYAGGGGGCASNGPQTPGGKGGGGDGASNDQSSAAIASFIFGLSNSGGGGGGIRDVGAPGAGGSGIVIVRYAI